MKKKYFLVFGFLFSVIITIMAFNLKSNIRLKSKIIDSKILTSKVEKEKYSLLKGKDINIVHDSIIETTYIYDKLGVFESISFDKKRLDISNFSFSNLLKNKQINSINSKKIKNYFRGYKVSTHIVVDPLIGSGITHPHMTPLISSFLGRKTDSEEVKMMSIIYLYDYKGELILNKIIYNQFFATVSVSENGKFVILGQDMILDGNENIVQNIKYKLYKFNKGNHTLKGVEKKYIEYNYRKVFFYKNFLISKINNSTTTNFIVTDFDNNNNKYIYTTNSRDETLILENNNISIFKNGLKKDFFKTAKNKK